MSGKHPRRRKRRKGRKPSTTAWTQAQTATPPPAPLNFSTSITTIRDRFQLLKQRASHG